MGEPVVIDTKYLTSDRSADFTLKKETSWRPKGWSITGGDGNLLFRTESLIDTSFSDMERIRLLDATGNQVVCFEEKVPSGTSWNVFSGTSDQVLLFSLKSQSRTYMEVFLPYNYDPKNPDYKIQCPEWFISSRFSILHGTQEVAVVKRVTKWSKSTTFTVTVFPGTDQVLVLVLTIIVELVRETRSRKQIESVTEFGTIAIAVTSCVTL